MTTFDFQDGNGPVPAHQHPKGNGWVADSATVDGSAYVGPDALVSDNAKVSGNARVYGDARVYGNAQVHGDATTREDLGSKRPSGGPKSSKISPGPDAQWVASVKSNSPSLTPPTQAAHSSAV